MDTIFGEIKKTNHKITTEGIMSTFGKGRVYRHPGHPAMAELAGTHYEMGLQYGVLLKPEIIKGIEAFTPMFYLSAEKAGIPGEYLLQILIQQAKMISAKIPPRFTDELKGISDGSGIDLDIVMAMALSYDASMLSGCTGLIMRDPEGRIIHGRHDDSALSYGEASNAMMVIVRFSPEGYHWVVQPGPILFPGVETGISERGIAFSEETLHPREVNQSGDSLSYFVRMVLEEADTLEEVLKLAEDYRFIAGYGMVWSSRIEQKALLLEAAGERKNVTWYQQPLNWNFNQYYSAEMIEYEQPMRRAVGYVTDREELAAMFPAKEGYDLKDALAFLRIQENDKEENYAWSGSRTAICNSHSQKTTIFDPEGDGFYFAYDNDYSGHAAMYHYHDDFSVRPELWAEKVELPEIIKRDALIENMAVSDGEKLLLRIRLADEYPNDANMSYVVSSMAFHLGQPDTFTRYALKAYALNRSVAEYALWAAIARLMDGCEAETGKIISDIQVSRLTPYQDLIRLWLLVRIDPSAENLHELEKATAKYDLKEVAEDKIFSLLENMLKAVRTE